MATAVGSYVTTALLKARANITDTNDDTVLGVICDQINQYIETKTQRVFAPITSTTYLYDGDGSRCVYLPKPVDKTPIGGLRAVTLVEMAARTGYAFSTLDASYYFLRNRIGMTGPYTQLVISDRYYSPLPYGYGVWRITGTAGWSAIPDDIAEAAVVTATKAWHAAQNGETNVVGSDEMGKPVVNPEFLKARLYETIMTYAITDVLAF